MRIYALLLHGSEGAPPQMRKFNTENSALEMERETAHCWYLSDAPHGFPERFNKSEEYRMQRNKHGFYMFGRDAEQLAASWNQTVGVSE